MHGGPHTGCSTICGQGKSESTREIRSSGGGRDARREKEGEGRRAITKERDCASVAGELTLQNFGSLGARAREQGS